MFELLQADHSVRGFCLGNPQSTYFSVGKIGDEQLADLAQLRGAQAIGLAGLLAHNL